MDTAHPSGNGYAGPAIYNGPHGEGIRSELLPGEIVPYHLLIKIYHPGLGVQTLLGLLSPKKTLLVQMKFARVIKLFPHDLFAETRL
jgi:hypothetical protein